mmetsp:Transcript_96583/g.270368  ORF Transcript_96583/g.270368 Transcript_96583/m.270368 type:complete len:138 (+) Transcript_96583:74-487(+)
MKAHGGMSATTTVQTALTTLCKQVDGLRSIVVTDRDGVVVLRAPETVIDDQTADQILTTIFALTTDQTSKIEELGAANFILTTYDNCICLQSNAYPLVVRMIASAGSNAGALIDLLPQIEAVLGPTKEVMKRETETY